MRGKPRTVLGNDGAVGREPAARFGDLVAAEWMKLRSLRSTYWVLGLGAVVVIAINIQATMGLRRDISAHPERDFSGYNWMNEALGQAPYLLLMIGAGAVGALMMVGEYATGMIRTTFAAVPARRAVVGAKITVVAAVMLILGAVISIASVGLTQAILSGTDATFSVNDTGVGTAVAASALALPACALVGLAIGVVVRHTAAAIVAVFTVVIILPQLTSSADYAWLVDVNNAFPWTAWMALRNTPIRDLMPADMFPWTITASWLALLAWPVVSTVVATVVAHRRDV